jgi:hypothetical protein
MFMSAAFGNKDCGWIESKAALRSVCWLVIARAFAVVTVIAARPSRKGL